MFTGLVSDVGEIVAVDEAGAGRRCRIACSRSAETIPIGASIACAGPCLTVVALTTQNDGRTAFDVDVSAETLERTTLKDWRIGTRVNLESSLKLGEELGGHLVTGHIDGVATIVERIDDDETSRISFEAPPEFARFIAEKGSVCLDGTSLTVNGVEENRFWVTLIPHTLAITTWGAREAGDRVNLEIDLLARYVARLAEANGS